PAVGRFLKNAWNKEPVITVSCGIGLLACVLPALSPLTKYTGMMNQAIPYNYPGRFFHVLSHVHSSEIHKTLLKYFIFL
uniref:NADH dehydrogenase [ubiquinone] 1 alpha subcomplex subunit 3 n=1 Tax=Sinocyclocheilus anshuiensis TaxID=1608454 RepID=A0A671PUN0_9TELE